MSIVFYASEQKHTEDSAELTVKLRTGEKKVYVRAEVQEDKWPGPALREAKVHQNEIALNALPNSIVIVPKAPLVENKAVEVKASV